ncbi:MAG: aminotransferase class I/II-fold pyridoxal phosphate-dependent enzyme [Acidobacteria bacterium]|jgi:aspartate aminotransferase|nr:aminotransferase class I/II-fold pyridoxal phosphate-dependent enzyme [Acidobacteriota bacterium]
MKIESQNNHPDVNLNLNVRGLQTSPTLAINERCRLLQAEGRHVYRLGLGQSPFPVPESVVEKLRAHAHEKDYLPVRGLPALREAIAGYLRRRQGIERSAEDILVGPGSKELMFILQLVYYGDLVIPTPSWVTYAPQAHIIGRHIRWVPTTAEEGWPLRPTELDAVCRGDPGRPRLVILNYPSNPTGQSYSVEALKELAEVARRYRVILLSDEIYGEIDHQGRHVSIARFYPEGTIISSGLSKWCGAGGWRLGTFTFPSSLRWLLDAMAVVCSESFTATSAPIQYAAVRAFKGGIDLEQYLFHSRRILRALGGSVARRLEQAGVFCPVPEGAFYVFPDFGSRAGLVAERGFTTCAELCERVLEDTGVAFLPGEAFGRDPREFTVRIAYVDFDGARALVASRAVPDDQELDEPFLRSYCGPVVEAMDRLCGWVGC